jgi:hypothetical protein
MYGRVNWRHQDPSICLNKNNTKKKKRTQVCKSIKRRRIFRRYCEKSYDTALRRVKLSVRLSKAVAWEESLKKLKSPGDSSRDKVPLHLISLAGKPPGIG